MSEIKLGNNYEHHYKENQKCMLYNYILKKLKLQLKIFFQENEYFLNWP